MAGGRPTKYNKKHCKAIIKFFDQPAIIAREIDVITKKGEKKTITKIEANELPTMEAFSHKIKVHTDTLVEWAKKHKEFSVAVARAKQIQKNILIQNGLTGRYDAGFAKFVSINFTDMKDKSETALTDPEGGPLRVITHVPDPNEKADK